MRSSSSLASLSPGQSAAATNAAEPNIMTTHSIGVLPDIAAA